jgi:hypothetical protein
MGSRKVVAVSCALPSQGFEGLHRRGEVASLEEALATPSPSPIVVTRMRRLCLCSLLAHRWGNADTASRAKARSVFWTRCALESLDFRRSLDDQGQRSRQARPVMGELWLSLSVQAVVVLLSKGVITVTNWLGNTPPTSHPHVVADATGCFDEMQSLHRGGRKVTPPV